jgi:hypothetical protein
MSRDVKETSVHVAFDDYAPFDPSEPEKSLLRAILITALADLKKPGEVGRRAQEYFLSGEEDYVFSFNAVCSYLNVDPDKVLTVTGLRGQQLQKAPSDLQDAPQG